MLFFLALASLLAKGFRSTLFPKFDRKPMASEDVALGTWNNSLLVLLYGIVHINYLYNIF